MLGVVADAVLAVLMIVLPAAWIIALVRWDGNCHCDKGGCENCPFSEGCKYKEENEE